MPKEQADKLTELRELDNYVKGEYMTAKYEQGFKQGAKMMVDLLKE